MGFWDDIGSAAKKVGKATGKALDVTTDVLVDKDAWKHTAQAMMDGPGGKKIRGEDLLNMALDSTMLIPGVGLAGGAARAGAKVGARALTKELAEQAATKTVDRTLLRSSANNAVRRGIDDLIGSKTAGAAVRKGLAEGGEKGAIKAGNKTAKAALKKSEARQAAKNAAPLKGTGRYAAKKNAGIGTRVGFGQSRRRILTNAALTGGINTVQGIRDRGLPGFDSPGDGKPKGDGPGPKGPAGPAGGDIDLSFLVGSDGSMTPAGLAFANAIAKNMQQNGKIRGSDIQYQE